MLKCFGKSRSQCNERDTAVLLTQLSYNFILEQFLYPFLIAEKEGKEILIPANQV